MTDSKTRIAKMMADVDLSGPVPLHIQEKIEEARQTLTHQMTHDDPPSAKNLERLITTDGYKDMERIKVTIQPDPPNKVVYQGINRDAASFPFMRNTKLADDEPPSAKNLENAENPTFGTVGGIDRSNNAISMKPSPYRLQPILNEDGGIDFKLEVDPGYCGIFGAETGKRDPFHWACSTLHDPHYQALLDGKDPGRTNVQTQWDFTKGILSTMAEGLYAVVTGPFYILFGAVLGGSLRFTQLQRRKAAKEGKPWSSNTPED